MCQPYATRQRKVNLPWENLPSWSCYEHKEAVQSAKEKMYGISERPNLPLGKCFEQSRRPVFRRYRTWGTAEQVGVRRGGDSNKSVKPSPAHGDDCIERCSSVVWKGDRAYLCAGVNGAEARGRIHFKCSYIP